MMRGSPNCGLWCTSIEHSNPHPLESLPSPGFCPVKRPSDHTPRHEVNGKPPL
ncbi:Protein of unknown function [Pyronema omphalodes CBS 100304]|uniref:Uncharacterized protein n=1 Tax=Pyronema omphalodes (strain CBS 100304) TaxID=1076935 RepID=U4L338_PYROM|nr:Protein of unknown function [Pyronema omphalodes CBS 100304]